MDISRDEQEARSIRYSGGTLALVPLSSGNWAVFSAHFTHLAAIISDFSELDPNTLRELAASGQRQYYANMAASASVGEQETETEATTLAPVRAKLRKPVRNSAIDITL